MFVISISAYWVYYYYYLLVLLLYYFNCCPYGKVHIMHSETVESTVVFEDETVLKTVQGILTKRSESLRSDFENMNFNSFE